MKHILNQSHFESKVREIYHPFQGNFFCVQAENGKPLSTVYSINYLQTINSKTKFNFYF